MHKPKKIARSVGAPGISLLRRLTTALVLGYGLFILLFYFLAGDQLHLRESRGISPSRRRKAVPWNWPPAM